MADQIGYYAAKVKRPYVTAVGAKDTPVFAIEFTVTHFKGDGWEQLQSPMTRTVNLFLTEAALPYTTEKLQRLEFNGDYQAPALTDRPVELEAKEDGEYVRWNLAKGSAPREVKPVEASVLSMLTAQWAAEFGAPAAPAPAPAPAPVTPPVAPPVAPPVVADPVAAGDGWDVGAETIEDIPFS